ncbi:MAG: STAS domain-containing protein [Candidatus Eremiobacteraeota bacterium]|nr:STAS domain-containing protein [Candidatus Eremiobacteraeota bacterium]MBV9700724.1 STAS domain-containing protein [Candidatus Eremiobacteraeota bacterium]
MTEKPHFRRVVLSGEYDLLRRDELREIFASLGDEPEITLDLGGVTYVDSSFLDELGKLRLRLPDHSITLVGADATVRRLLEITSMHKIFTVQ